MSKMKDNDLINKWLCAFGADVDKIVLEENITSEGNFLWHLFTWGGVPCMKEDDARAAFDSLQYTDAIRFCDGYSMHIEGTSNTGKVTAKEIDADPAGDLYIVAKDFSWTYVRTHESSCGPYFCERGMLETKES